MKNFKSLLLLLIAFIAVNNLAYSVDYSLGGYLNGQDVNGFSNDWKFTQSGSEYVLTKTFSTANNYFVVYDSNNTKYGAGSYTENNPSTLVQNGGEKVGALGLSTSSVTTITFNPSNKQIKWEQKGGTTGGSLSEPYVISVYIKGVWGEQYTFTPVPGSTNYEYEATIEIPNYTGNPSDYWFWVGDNNAWSGTYSEEKNLGDFVSDCETGVFYAKIYALNDQGKPHGSDYKNFGIHDFRCSESPAKLTLTSSVREFDTSNPPASITLTATADDKTEGNYIWYFSSDAGQTYKKLGETATNTLELSDGKIPTESRWDFKVARKLVGQTTNKEAFCVIYTIQSCGANTKGSNIFHEDFGTLAAEDDRGEKDKYDGIVSGYYYQEAPYKVNDGYYAVVANPYYSGCGEGGDNDNKVDAACLARLQWFRDLPDHSLYNETETGPYGGMLLINFKAAGIAYQRELTTDQAKNIRKNSILTFSAYFASAAKEREGVAFNPIKMDMIIQFQKKNETTWNNVATISSEVTEREGWQRSEVAWTVEDDNGKFRVVIDNKGAGEGNGNDLLVDDIRLDLCTPAFAMHFYDEETQAEEVSVEAANVEEVRKIRVQKIDFGTLGQEVCMQAYQVHVEGVDTTYTYLTDMVLNNGYYVADVSAVSLFDNVPDKVQITCVASALDNGKCNGAIQENVEDGDYKPGKQNDAIFASNILDYSISCGTSSLSNNETVAKICQGTDAEPAKMPVLKLESTNISNVVEFDIRHNGQTLLGGLTYQETAPGYMLLDINKLYADANGGKTFPWPVGTNTFTVMLREKLVDDYVCERLVNGAVSIQVVKRPQITADLVGKEICKGTSEELSITASPVSQYQWQTMAPGDSDWSNVGTNSSTFSTPTTMANETQYRVLMYNDNTLKCATTSAVATMTTKLCEEMSLGQAVDKSSVCQDDEITYTVTLTNGAAAEATNLSATVVWDSNVLELQQDGLPANFDATTGVWSVGEMQPGTQSLNIKFKVISVPTGTISIKSYISSLNETTYGSYDRQPKTTMKGESTVTIKSQAVAPTPKRKGEIYAFNICKGDKTYGDPISYNFLLEDKMDDGSNFDKSNLVWMDENYNVIDAANANFSVNTLQDVTLYVYNEPAGYCKSDIVQVRYRVKENTSTPKVKDYIDCVDPEAEEVLLKTRVENESDYKYLVFTDESGDEVRVFDPSQVGETTYTVVAYKDEIGTCPSEVVELLVKVKDYAVAGNIAADGAEICPGADITLSAETQFDETQTNVVIRWYSDPNLSKESLLTTDDDYDMEKVLTDTYVYVTVETNNYCENQAGDAKDVYVAMKQASPELSITPKEQVITIGGKPSFVVTPNYVGQAAEYSVYVNDVQVESLADYKPYIDSEYIIVFDGECGTTSDSARVTVQWPTVFTPYELDGLNDTFVKDMDPNFHTAIFNRFGMPLIETENGWDGKLPSGDLAVPGVYYYVVTLPDANVKKGTIEVFKK